MTQINRIRCSSLVMMFTVAFNTVTHLYASEDARTARQKGVALLRSIVKDASMPTQTRTASLQVDENIESQPAGIQRNDGLTKIRFVLTPVGPKLPVNDFCELFIDSSNQVNLNLFLTNQDVLDAPKEPDWEKLVPLWDGFVSRYWAGLSRESDWRQSMAHYEPARGVFTLHYSQKEQGVELASVDVDVRLADGKIGGLRTLDRRIFMKEVFKNHPAPLPPSRQTLIKAILRSINDFPYWKPKEIVNPQIVNVKRSYSKIYPRKSDQGQFVWNSEVRVLCDAPGQKHYLIQAVYEDERNQAYIETISDPATKDQLQLSSSGSQQVLRLQKPFTLVSDNQVSWDSDAKHIYFTTTRDFLYRPWWTRGSMLMSVAAYDTESSHGKLTLIRPMKPIGMDEDAYDEAYSSISGQYLLATRASSGKIFFLDLNRGIIFLPSRTATWRKELLEHLPNEEYLTDGVTWQASGAAWLPRNNSVILATPLTSSHNQLVVAQTPNVRSVGEWDLKAVVTVGAVAQPHLSNGGQSLAYFEQKKLNDPHNHQRSAWDFVVADYSVKTNDISNTRKLSLASEPCSISWDTKTSRWLVVTQDDTIWVTDEDGNLKSSPALPKDGLFWGKIALKPTSAAISPLGYKIAVAAELSTPQVYDKTECVVGATIFLWDGKSQQVKPLFDPSLNGIPRYVFPATHSPWATIIGDVQKFGLQGVADPRTFIKGAPTQTNTVLK